MRRSPAYPSSSQPKLGLRKIRVARHVPAVVLVVMVALVVAACSSSKSSGGSSASTSASKGVVAPGSDVGLTASTIRIGLVADVATSVEPGLFQKNVDVMNAWAALVNAQGGLAGRQVVIDFIDSKLDPNATRNALITACSRDFALVGTAALSITTMADIVACKNSSGQAAGMPDVPGIAFSTLERCSPTTYTASGLQGGDCSTLTQHPQTYTENIGDTKYLLSTYPGLHGTWLINNDTPASKLSQTPTYTAEANAGIKKDGQGFYYNSGAAPQSSLTPVVQVMKSNSSTFSNSGSTPGSEVLLRREAALQGLNTVKVWECNSGCYDANFIKQGGTAVDGTYAQLLNLPFYSEYKDNPALSSLVTKLGSVNDIDNNSLGSYTAALLFQDAVNKAIANGGTLNRSTLFTALKDEHSFDAQGIIGATDVGNRKPSPCDIVVQLKNGVYQRSFPTKTGTFDCNAANLVTFQMDVTQ
jgi:hypothetical protein